MTDVTIAGHTVRDARTVVQGYVAELAPTIKKYDFFDAPRAGITVETVEATRIVASRISHEAERWFVERGASARWDLVPFDAKLADADAAVAGGLYDGMTMLWDQFWGGRPPQVGTGKVSKVLHLARPAAFPILDSKVRKVYRRAAREAALAVRDAREGFPEFKYLFWEAIRLDVVANAESLRSLRVELASSELALAQECGRRLSDVRLLDICAWKIGKSGTLA